MKIDPMWLWHKRWQTGSCFKVVLTLLSVLFGNLLRHSFLEIVVTGDQMKHTVTMDRLVDLFGFEHCQIYLGCCECITEQHMQRRSFLDFLIQKSICHMLAEWDDITILRWDCFDCGECYTELTAQAFETVSDSTTFQQIWLKRILMLSFHFNGRLYDLTICGRGGGLPLFACL